MPGNVSACTEGKMIEFIAEKVGVFEGRCGDGTAFHGDKVEVCAESLVRAGYNYNGKPLRIAVCPESRCERWYFLDRSFTRS